MRSKNEYRYKIRQLADYLSLSVYQLTMGYMDATQMHFASLKDLRLTWRFLLETRKVEICAMDNEDY